MSWDLGKTCQLTYAVIDYGLGKQIWDVLLSTFSHKLLKVRSSTVTDYRGSHYLVTHHLVCFTTYVSLPISITYCRL